MSLYSEKSKITRTEHSTLIGLLLLAAKGNDELGRIGAAVAEILGEKPDHGHALDAVYSNDTIDELMRKTGLVIVDDPCVLQGEAIDGDPGAIANEVAAILDRTAKMIGEGGPIEEQRQEVEELLAKSARLVRTWSRLVLRSQPAPDPAEVTRG